MSTKQKLESFGYSLAVILTVAALCIFVVGMRSATAISFYNTNIEEISPTQNPASRPASGLVAGSQNNAAPVLVEMFLSQSCSSCVPAARYVSELSKRNDLVVLSWHVDYWDDLVVFKHGKWKDPYSDAAYTYRQRNYSLNAPSGRVYTPQAIVAGSFEGVGSRKNAIEPFINEAKKTTSAKLELTYSDDTLTASVNNKTARDRYDATLVFFHDNTKTSILGGENAGQNWSETHVVKTTRPFAVNQDKFTASLTPTDLSDGTGCAVIVQERQLGKVVAASYCPQI